MWKVIFFPTQYKKNLGMNFTGEDTHGIGDKIKR